MDDRLAPALTPEGWADAAKYGVDILRAECGPIGYVKAAEVLALANHALPDSDPRKITRGVVEMMLRAAWDVPDGYSVNVSLANFADALQSYLPPDTA